MEALRMWKMTPDRDIDSKNYYMNIMIKNEQLLRSNYFNSIMPKKY